MSNLKIIFLMANILFFSTIPVSLANQFVSPELLMDNIIPPAQPTEYIRSGAGKNNVLQGIALDEKNNVLYTLHVTGKPEMGAVNEFKLQQANTIKADSIQLPSGFIGHQGISLDPRSGDLYASSGMNIRNKGWNIVKFRFAKNELPKETFVIKVFKEGYDTKVSTMPTFTPDGKIILVRGKKGGTDIIRTYDTSKLKSNISDISDIYLDEWSIDKSLTKDNYDLQAITTDGKRVFILSGGGNSLPKRLFVYDMKGKLVQKLGNVTLGFTQAKSSGIEKHWEPEGMAYAKNSNSLMIAFAIGDFKARKAIVFRIPMNAQ